MTPLQNLYVLLFTFGPGFLVSQEYGWEIGIAVVVVIMAINFVSGLLLTPILLSMHWRLSALWAWVKPPLVAILVAQYGLQLIV